MKKINESLAGINWQKVSNNKSSKIICYSNVGENKSFTILSKSTINLFEEETKRQYNDFFDIQKDKLLHLKNIDNRLRDYQINIVKQTINRKSFGNFSEQRTGKTPTTLVSLKIWNKKTIIICPSSVVLGTWCSAIRDWLNIDPLTMFENKLNMKQILISKPKDKNGRVQTYKDFFMNDKFNCLVVSKDTIKRDSETLQKNVKKFNGEFNIVVDEAQFLKGWQSNKKHTEQTNVCMMLSKFADRKIALTATPSANHPSEIFGIYHFLWPDRFDNYQNFIKFFWGITKPYFKVKNKFRNKKVTEIFEEIYKEMAIRVEQKDVIKWIPKINYKTVELFASKNQANAIFEWVCYKKLNNKESEKNKILQLEKQIVYGILANVVEQKEKIYSVKFEWILNYIKENNSNNLIIATKWSNRVLKLLSSYLNIQKIEHYLIIGGIKRDKIEEIKNKINTKGGIILANISILKEGHKFNNINEIIFLDRSWNPADNDQFIQRMMPTTLEESWLNNYKLVIDLIIKYPISWESIEDDKIAKIAKKILTEEKILELLNLKISINSYIQKLNNYKTQDILEFE